MMGVGFFLARKLPSWASLALLLVLEVIPLFVIRDNLTLNVWMLAVRPTRRSRHGRPAADRHQMPAGALMRAMKARASPVRRCLLACSPGPRR